MAFNSFPFLFFFVSFFVLYWFIFNRNLKFQNLLLLTGSYLFYAYTDWRLLSYLVGSSVLNFYLGIYSAKATTRNSRRLFLYIGLIQGIGGLAFFKYYNFFIFSFNAFFQSLSINFNLQTFNIIVSLGISFFTFRTISYILDVDKRKIKPATDMVIFLNYVSFFPSLLSGPIDRAKTFIPQLEKKRVFDYNQSVDGLRQILWGLFKKIVIADNCAIVTSQIFGNYTELPASSLFLGAFFYTIQVYADFSGYSDMAIGFSRLIGFKITKNFDYPYFAQSIAEFWRKWHISLTSWLTEYVFTPLMIEFRRLNKLGLILAVLINLTIVGIWHGANWTYVLYGFLHGCYFIPLILRNTMNTKKKIAKDKLLPSCKEFLNMLKTFSLVMVTFILIRVESISQAIDYYKRLFSMSLFTLQASDKTTLLMVMVLIFVMFVIEWLGREEDYAIAKTGFKWPKQVRWTFYYILALSIFYFSGSDQQFVYFQF